MDVIDLSSVDLYFNEIFSSDIKRVKKSDGTYFTSLNEYEEFIRSKAKITIIKNYKNLNRTLIKLVVDLSDCPLDFRDVSVGSDGYISSFYDSTYIEGIKANVYVPFDAVEEYGTTYTNRIYLKQIGYDNTSGSKDIYDFDDDGDTTEIFNSNSDTESIIIASESHQDLSTQVKSSISNYSNTDGRANYNSIYTYKIRARNSNNKITNLVLYDSLEKYAKVNNNFVLAAGDDTNTFKGTFESVDTSHAKSQGYTVKVYYSESEQPGSLSGDTSWNEYIEGTTDKSKVKSLAFEYYDENGNKAILPENSSTYVEINMKSPASSDKLKTYNGSWSEWNALDTNGNVINDVTGINGNIVDVNLPCHLNVHHYIKGTITKLSADVVNDQIFINDTYETSQASDIPYYYQFDSNAGDATSGTISKLNTDVIYYYVRKTPNVDSTISKTGTNEINKRTNEVDYQITYTPTVKDFNGSASITITDTLPYGIDTSKSNLDGGTYDSSKHTITWTKNVNVITQEYSETITHNISVYYTGIPAKIRKITNKVSGSVTADSQTSTKETTKDTNINEPFKLIVKYLEYGTNKVLSNELSFTVYGGDAYETHSASDIPADYDLKIKPTNYKGTIQNEVTTVIWYYERRNPNIDSTISKTGTDEITHSNDVVSYEITYKPTIKDYVGNGNVKIIDTLPYHIDLDLSDLNGGTYNDEDKTITWTDTWNITNVSGENKEYKYNISVVYTDIDLTKDTMNNVVNGSIKLENGESNKETTHITNINVKGTIIVHYIDIETNEELCEQIETTDKVGNTYVPFLKNLKAMI